MYFRCYKWENKATVSRGGNTYLSRRRHCWKTRATLNVIMLINSRAGNFTSGWRPPRRLQCLLKVSNNQPRGSSTRGNHITLINDQVPRSYRGHLIPDNDLGNGGRISNNMIIIRRGLETSIKILSKVDIWGAITCMRMVARAATAGRPENLPQG